jgi:phosphoenolpyruvate carboxykinase (GTP)
VPAVSGIDTTGLELDDVKLQQLLEVDEDEWREELPLIEAHFAAIGERLPQELQDELAALEKRLAG